jgi:DNA polymerase-1
MAAGTMIDISEKRVFLIDGFSLLYRSYYAIRNLSNADGFPTNAIFGFLVFLKKLKSSEKLGYLGVVMDSRGPTFRHDQYGEYKANRKPMPEDLSRQLPKLREVLGALRIPVIEYPGYEGDDVLGSLAKIASSKNIPSVLVTTDKDLFQLVDDQVSVYNPAKEQYFNPEAVREFFGVSPNQVVDVLALWGDPSDNVPGVPGIGEKTAKALIQEYGSIQNLLDNLPNIKPRLKEKIEKHLGQLTLSRALVTIEKDLDLSFDLDDYSLSPPDTKVLVPLFEELEFQSFAAEYASTAPEEKPAYAAIKDSGSLEDLVRAISEAGFVSLDTETTHLQPTQARLVGISFSLAPGQATYLPLGHDYPEAPTQIARRSAYDILRPILQSENIKKTGQNIKYDYIVLKREGIELKGIDRDSMVLSYLLQPNQGRHSLDRLALEHLRLKTVKYSEIVGKGKNEVTMNSVPIDRVTPYACQDADLALRLSYLLAPRVQEEGLGRLYEELERPLIPVLAEMEMAGIAIDAPALRELSAEMEKDMARLQKKVFDISGEEINLNSPQQLAYLLFEKLKLPASRKTKITKGYSTSMDVLKDLAPKYPIAQHMLEYRQLKKLKSGYADSLPLLINPLTGRIHTSFNQTVAATGRLSSSDPNLQNIPARGEMGIRFRQAFIPSEGHLFLSADYAQIELRVLAHLSEDPALIQAFVNDRDIHEETADQVFGQDSGLFREEQRHRAKIINFSVIYGTSAFSLARELGTTTSEAQRFIDRYYERYPKVLEYLENSVEEAKKSGYSITLFGRKRPLPELRQRDRVVQQAGRRIALNTPIQGTAADLMKKAMIDIWNFMKAEKLKTRMILQVHDELVFEVPDSEQEIIETLVQEKMEQVIPLKVPLKVHLGWGVNWAEAK